MTQSSGVPSSPSNETSRELILKTTIGFPPLFTLTLYFDGAQ
jgi:hypothetical protein